MNSSHDSINPQDDGGSMPNPSGRIASTPIRTVSDASATRQALGALGAVAAMGAATWLKKRRDRRKDASLRAPFRSSRDKDAPKNASWQRFSSERTAPPAPLEPTSAEYLYTQGKAARDRGEQVEAIRYFGRAARLYQQLPKNPSLATPHLAQSLFELAKLAEEQDRPDIARQRFGESAQVFHTVSLVAQARGDHKTAAAARQQSEAIRRWAARQNERVMIHRQRHQAELEAKREMKRVRDTERNLKADQWRRYRF